MGPAIGTEQARERINAAIDAIDAAHDGLRDTCSDLLGNRFRVDIAQRLETQARANRGLLYRFFAGIARRSNPGARRRPRRSPPAPPVPPELPTSAAAVQAGAIGEDHIRAICR